MVVELKTALGQLKITREYAGRFDLFSETSQRQIKDLVAEVSIVLLEIKDQLK